MRLRGAIVAISLFFLPFVAQAQAQAPAPQPPADARAAAKELIEAMQATDQLKKMMPLIMQQLKPAIVQNRPEVEKDFDAALPMVLEAMNARMGEFAESIAAIYAFNFTADELRQVTAFYRSPVGQKFVAKLPAITQQSLAVGQKFGQDIAGDMRQRMIDQLRKKGHNI
ncbi:MAG TPA: DUF2059 domain-containing protein [Xanthobacteraceae bacterium]|nr:DUF2059 domain-containing protein [Xanthobacteraceae bacterium]